MHSEVICVVFLAFSVLLLVLCQTGTNHDQKTALNRAKIDLCL